LASSAPFFAGLEGNAVRLGPRLLVSFERTLRVPDDGRSYPLPPSLGRFPLYAAARYAGRVPEEWVAAGVAFLPMYQREALWLGFGAASWKPNALIVSADGVNVVSGQPWEAGLSATPQNYLVVPAQPWLDGIRGENDTVRQFVAVPLGAGYGVGEQVLGGRSVDGLQFRAFEPKPGIFPDKPPPLRADLSAPMRLRSSGPGSSLGLGAGGTIRQRILRDPHGIDTWELDGRVGFTVHIVNSERFHEIAGEAPPATPISPQIYTDHGFPWFELYEESPGIETPSGALGGVRSIAEIDAARRIGGDSGASIKIPESQIRRLRRRKSSTPPTKKP
jgi:hypothetical protein